MVDLLEAGLTSNEAKVYSALLDLGPSLAGGIARKTGLHRRTVYDTTEMLIQKGLVAYILQNNRRIFKAEDPKRLLDMLEERKELLDPLVGDLQKKFSKTREKEETNFYKGRQGLKSVFEDQLREKEIFILGANNQASDILQYYFTWYNKKRISKKITTKVIAYSRKLARMKRVAIKFLPEKYANPVAVNIYGEKVAIILWAQEPFAIVIKNKQIADAYKTYFNLMWRMAKE